jgi:hypothetical protein
MESPNGAWLYFMKSKDEFSGPLLKMPSAGGPETPVLPAVFHRGFAPVAKGVYYRQEEERGSSIRFLDTTTGATRLVQQLAKHPFRYLDVSPDEQFVLWTQADQWGSDLKLIENFK